MRLDPEEVALRIAAIAEDEILARFGRLEPGAVREKSGPSDLVTEADEAAERALRIALHDIRPDAAFVGEELAARDPAIAEAIAKSDAVWIVDPLDGTRNFIRGVAEFAVIVALVEKGATRAGWIYAAPIGKCAVAVAGEGARYGGAAFRIRAATDPRPRGLRSVGYLPVQRQKQLRAALAANFETAPGHCSAYAYLKLAEGEVDFKLSSRIHPWDHAAGALLLAELGGETSFLDHRARYTPQVSLDAPLLGVAPGRDWAAIAARLR